MPKLTDQTALTSPDKLDLIHVVDVSDPTSNAAGTSKKVQLQYLPSAIADEIKEAIADASPINNQTDSYVLVLTDKDRLVRINKATDCTVTVPTNTSVAFPLGTEIAIEQAGAGELTIVGADETVLLHYSSVSLVFNTQYSTAAIKKVDTNTWLVAGDLI